MMIESISQAKIMTFEFAYLALFDAHFSEKQLLRGFTTVRDLVHFNSVM